MQTTGGIYDHDCLHDPSNPAGPAVGNQQVPSVAIRAMSDLDAWIRQQIERLVRLERT